MIPILILNNFYAFDEEYVNDQIQKANLEGSISGRVGGVRYRKTDSGKEVLAWQCNLANVQSFDVKLPTIIHIAIDEDNNIKAITLNERFKGSQGIPCSWKYLNRHMRSTLLATGFSPHNPLITNPLILSCRHTYELVLGSCTFLAYCESQGIKNAFLSESTIAYANKCDDMIDLVDRICINDNDVVTKMSVCNYRNTIKHNRSGTISACDDLRISVYSYCNNEYICLGSKKNIHADNCNDFKMKVMKTISKIWLESGKRLGVTKDFYFSQIWPPTSYGLLTQAFALTMFKDNYLYFQHCVSGIQRIEGKPLCIGVIHNVEEGATFFDGFGEDDLF